MLSVCNIAAPRLHSPRSLPSLTAVTSANTSLTTILLRLSSSSASVARWIKTARRFFSASVTGLPRAAYSNTSLIYEQRFRQPPDLAPPTQPAHLFWEAELAQNRDEILGHSALPYSEWMVERKKIERQSLVRRGSPRDTDGRAKAYAKRRARYSEARGTVALPPLSLTRGGR